MLSVYVYSDSKSDILKENQESVQCAGLLQLHVPIFSLSNRMKIVTLAKHWI